MRLYADTNMKVWKEAGGIVYELSEVDHHRGSHAKAKEEMEGTIREEQKGHGGGGGKGSILLRTQPTFSNGTLVFLQGHHQRRGAISQLGHICAPLLQCSTE